MEKVSLHAAFGSFDEQWAPRVAAGSNAAGAPIACSKSTTHATASSTTATCSGVAHP
jgi:hypothetical protein